MISLDLETENEAASPTSTPKLSLYKLPSKQRQPPPVMFTPPVTTSAASIPFQWEEVPGKLRPDFRPTSSPAAAVKDKNSSVARCLDLPPRLLNNKNNTSTAPHNIIHHPPSKQLFPVTNDSSPTTVLDGPYPHGAGGPSFSRSSAFSLPKTRGSFRSLEDEIFRDVNKYRQHRHDAIDEVVGKRKVINDKERFASWKWGSYKENNATTNDGSFSFSAGYDHSFGCTSFASTSRGTIKRRSSFSSFSHASSNLIAGIYGSFKQVLPWRRRQGQKKDQTVG
ncbi:uncharacterized protein At4g00950 [Coffea arabica]|uniref:Uncharacterized protein At4g00950 n=1 Tax=Coffea arabica TaxID=13443 RepID=A0A6P6W7G3_COFAR|nr:uncharacterized protein At4g00950-like [Coffea arabica]